MNKQRFAGICGLLILASCAAQQAKERMPILYPSEELDKKPHAQVERDIEECDYRADHYVKKPTTGQQVRDVFLSGLEDAAVGSAAGALGGTIMGSKVGRATGAGAAAGGLIGAYGAIKEMNKVDPKEREFIKACLEEKGYKVIGWEAD